MAFTLEKKPSSEAVAEYLEGRKQYEGLRKQKQKGSNREQQVKEGNIHHTLWPNVGFLSCCVKRTCPLWQTLSILNSFKTKLSSAIAEQPEEDTEDDEEDNDKGWWVKRTRPDL